MMTLTAELRKVLAESYHEKNTKTTVNYPYLTYDIDAELKQVESEIAALLAEVATE